VSILKGCSSCTYGPQAVILDLMPVCVLFKLFQKIRQKTTTSCRFPFSMKNETMTTSYYYLQSSMTNDHRQPMRRMLYWARVHECIWGSGGWSPIYHWGWPWM